MVVALTNGWPSPGIGIAPSAIASLTSSAAVPASVPEG
jgi:hypothetical protein